MRNIYGIAVSILMLLGPVLSWAAPLVSPDRLAARTEARYTLYPMKSGYLEKDKRKGVVYLPEQAREQHRAVVVAGIIYNSKGEVFPDSRLAGGTYQYVMDKAGNIYIFDDQPTLRHSSILAGEPVAAAGDVKIETGLITYIDTNSGHYFVFVSVWRDALEQAFRELAANGVDTNALGHASSANGVDSNALNLVLKELTEKGVDMKALDQVIKGLTAKGLDMNALGLVLKGFASKDVDAKALNKILMDFAATGVDTNALPQVLKDLAAVGVDPNVLAGVR